jgi:hypothetical protein
MVRRLTTGVLGVLLALQLMAAGVSAAGTAFQGVWVSTDGDGSQQALLIGAGQRPSVVYQDFFASACEGAGSRSTHWVAAGSGEIDGDTLAVHFHKSGCGAFSIGEYDDTYEYDAGDDVLVDSFGIVWSRL